MRVPSARGGQKPVQRESRPVGQSPAVPASVRLPQFAETYVSGPQPVPGPDGLTEQPQQPGRRRLPEVVEEDEKVEREVERLTQPDWLKDVESGEGDRHASVRAEISNAMVGLKKNFYGKGPTKAKTFLNDNYVFCVMEGGLTRNEETLIERGHQDLVRTYRLRFQEAMEDPTVEAVQRITGRSVIGYHSQIVFNPERAFEIFVLGRPLGDSG
jgi:uncharacterized protein YbcI